MTRRDRITARLARREEWAEKAHAASDAAHTAAHRAVDGIPFGQPVLVGHHSEGHHRRALERADSAMSRAVERSKMAGRHEAAAVNLERALDRSVFSDDPDAPDALRARIAAHEAQRSRYVALNKLIRREMKVGLPPGWLDRIGATDRERSQIEGNVNDWRREPLFPSYVMSNLGGRITADRKRLASIERQQATQAKAEAAPGGVVIEGGDYVAVTFAEKPAREVLDALKVAGFHWSGGSWCGYRRDMPADVLALTADPCPDCGGAGIETPDVNIGPACGTCAGEGWTPGA